MNESELTNQMIQIKLMHKQLSMEHWINYEASAPKSPEVGVLFNTSTGESPAIIASPANVRFLP